MIDTFPLLKHSHLDLETSVLLMFSPSFTLLYWNSSKSMQWKSTVSILQALVILNAVKKVCINNFLHSSMW